MTEEQFEKYLADTRAEKKAEERFLARPMNAVDGRKKLKRPKKEVNYDRAHENQFD